MAGNPRKLVIWRFSDGRRGHDSQSRGLLRAFESLHPCVHAELPSGSTITGLRQLPARLAGSGLPRSAPDLLIGAGHATHIPMLAARLRFGGRSVVLMRPTLPYVWFDFCLVPAHDEPPAERSNVIVTEGPLTPPLPDLPRDPSLGIVLVGGPSRHFLWQPEALLAQIGEVIAGDNRRWLLCDSPRTPAETCSALRALDAGNTRYCHYRDQAEGWIGEQLAQAATAWISCDSLSMIYEALGAGAAVGVFELPPRREDDRNWRAVERLVRDDCVTRYSDWSRGAMPHPAPHRLNEARRCATLLLSRLGLDAAAAER